MAPDLFLQVFDGYFTLFLQTSWHPARQVPRLNCRQRYDMGQKRNKKPSLSLAASWVLLRNLFFLLFFYFTVPNIFHTLAFETFSESSLCDVLAQSCHRVTSRPCGRHPDVSLYLLVTAASVQVGSGIFIKFLEKCFSTYTFY